MCHTLAPDITLVYLLYSALEEENMWMNIGPDAIEWRTIFISEQSQKVKY